MFCHKCGAQIAEEAAFCHNCGTMVVRENAEPQIVDPPQSTDNERYESIAAIEQKWTDQKQTEESALAEEPPAEHKLSKFKVWWESCSKVKKALAVVAALLIGIFVLYVLVSFLREFGYLLFGIAVIGGFVVTLTTGTKEEKIEARKTIVQMVVGFVLICVIVFVIVLKPDFVSDVIQPGAGVRNAYLTQYSDKVTVEDAFQNFFANEKWSTYKSEGYSYVVFSGVCEYAGERADAQITFKITGDNFIVDHLDLNGVEQSDVMMALMLAKIYEDY